MTVGAGAFAPEEFLVNSAWKSVVMLCLALALVSPVRATEEVAAEEVTAEDLGRFYPALWEEEALGKPAFSHLEIPGHQKASSTRYYAFGLVEFIYYAPQDSVCSRRVAKLKSNGKKFEEIEISGYPVVVFEGNRAIADIGGEILAYLECYTCESREELMARFEKIELEGLGGLLER